MDFKVTVGKEMVWVLETLTRIKSEDILNKVMINPCCYITQRRWFF